MSVDPRRIVVAIGGNALLARDASGTDAEQLRSARALARATVGLVRRQAEVLVVHGNGPQVGNLLMQMEEAALKVPPSSLDVAVGMSQGSIGYFLEMALREQLRRRNIARQVVTILSLTRVAEEVGQLPPTKPVGPFLTRLRAQELQRRRGWTLMEDAGRGWRKLVPSPRPVEVLNAPIFRDLLAAGHVVVAGGGGGIPVRRDRDGRLVGVEAVIDKDYTAALLAREVGASLLVILTGVPHVSLHFRSERETPLATVTAAELKAYHAAGHFATGSMAPKVEAVLGYLEAGGKEAIVTEARSLSRALAGRAGTRISC